MRTTSRGKALAALLVLAVLPAVALASVPAPAAVLHALIAERLELMPAVAAAKWHDGQAIEDPVREALVIEAAVLAAARHGLDPQGVTSLFQAQIAAARSVQTYWFERWAAGRVSPPAAPDLAGEIRPALMRLGEDIVIATARAAVHDAGGLADRAALDRVLEMPGLGAADRDALHAALAEVRVLPNRLAQILAAGRLRVGSTGDYAPFAAPARVDTAVAAGPATAADLVGIDIDLARDLAESLGVKAEFVLTSWPGLLEDLVADRYDIAMSGVSRTLDRQRVGFLSAPYHADGKTPIGRCADRSRFATFEQIDRAGVRVVVNPGGTNERFVDTRIRHADKVLHPDNRTIFGELQDGRADVMFTDRIEVELQTARAPALCSLLATDLTYQEKAYLLPQDPHWQAFVDTWLALRLADGSVDAAFAAHGVRRRPAGVSAVPSN